jgi:predicted transcriptional regulator
MQTTLVTITPQELAEVASALSNDRKAEILLMLLSEQLTTEDIHQRTCWAISNISAYLKQLHSVGLVSSTRSSYYVYYRATGKAQRLLLALS